MDTNVLHQIVIRVAKEELLPRFACVKGSVKISRKGDGSLVTEADLAVQQRLIVELTRILPGSVVLAEEMTRQQQLECLQGDAPVWCLDPLDGTSNFTYGIPYFCISLALLKQGQVEVAVVYDPVRDELFSAASGAGANLNDEPLAVSDCNLALQHSLALIDFKRLAPDLSSRLVTDMPYGSQRSFGSVALDWCWVAAGRVHVYLHGRANLWDYVAGQAIFQEAGGQSTTLEGEPVFKHALEARSMVGAADARLFTEWTAYLGIRISLLKD